MGRAEKLAAKLLQERGISKPAIPVESIARDLDIRLRFEPFEGKEDISGMLFRDNDRTIIGVNTTHSTTRQRFTIAHEIGHYLLHRGQLFVDTQVSFRDSRSSSATDKGEIEANAFAAELLMPRELVVKEVQRRYAKNSSLSSEALINELSETFEVSPQAMQYRLINLGVICIS